MSEELKHELQQLTSCIKLLAEKIDTLIAMNKDIVRWLLIVVCVIALGRSAFDLGKELFFQNKNGSGVIVNDN